MKKLKKVTQLKDLKMLSTKECLKLKGGGVVDGVDNLEAEID